MKRQSVRFVGLFFLLVLVSTLLVRNAWIDERLILPYTSFIAGLSGEILELAGWSVAVEQTVIRYPTFSVDIRRGCDGVVATLVLVSAVVAYPASWRSRTSAAVIGFLLIFGLNLVRVVGLFSLGAGGRLDLFDLVHTYVSQFAIIASAMVFWLFWAGRQDTASP